MFDQLSTEQLIHRGRQLCTVIAESKLELDAIEQVLRDRALAMPHEPLADGNREGRRATLRDGIQQVAVLFESDILKASFVSDSPVAKAVLPLLDADQVKALFRKKTTYERAVKDGHKFRLQCADLLPGELAAQVIDLLKDRDRNGIVKSKSVIEWKSSAA
ncbi:MAG: hypothetical protein Q8Q59_08350 [Luteolibacter sp.]|jgi:hypothetical protein|nr:hypothetical protein [Luteolibacter sp.]